MSKINIQGIVDEIKSQTSPYTAIIEAVVNSIEAIRERDNKGGYINIYIDRHNQLGLEDTSDIRQIRIVDNGSGFTKKNTEAFDTFRTYNKRKTGGKGFGRFMYLKYFKEVRIRSVFQEEKDKYLRTFRFGKRYNIVENEKLVKVPSESVVETTLFLTGLTEINTLDKGINTISRQILERLLSFFVDDKFICPTITVIDEQGQSEICLNELIQTSDEISLFESGTYNVVGGHAQTYSEQFNIKVFKVYFAGSRKSKIHLVAHNRSVTETPLHKHIPEFEDDFFDEVTDPESGITRRKNYIIRCYVTGDYLDKNVSLEREQFDFPKDKPNTLFIVTQRMIEKDGAEFSKKLFPKDVGLRYERKVTRAREYVSASAPWHSSYVSDVDFSELSYEASDEEIELTLQRHKFQQEVESRKEIQAIIEDGTITDSERFEFVMGKITDIAKADLVHYVVSRKLVLETLESLLHRTEKGKGHLEKQVHSLIFPMNADTENTPYFDHNLWILDERLAFSVYSASDRKIGKDSPKEPDLVVFDKKRAYRLGENSFSNPLTIFEFKRPKRKEYTQEDDPIIQIGKYLKEIREGKYETPGGVEKVKVNESTPVYAYVVADLTDKIHEFARNHQLTESPDGEGYFGFHRGYGMYVKVVSFSKLLKDAKIRNKVFFHKLNIE